MCGAKGVCRYLSIDALAPAQVARSNLRVVRHPGAIRKRWFSDNTYRPLHFMASIPADGHSPQCRFRRAGLMVLEKSGMKPLFTCCGEDSQSRLSALQTPAALAAAPEPEGTSSGPLLIAFSRGRLGQSPLSLRPYFVWRAASATPSASSGAL
jgi:hypothetical protein